MLKLFSFVFLLFPELEKVISVFAFKSSFWTLIFKNKNKNYRIYVSHFNFFLTHSEAFIEH